MSKNYSKFVWYQLMTADIDAAKSFYKSVIGLDSQSTDIGGVPYNTFSVGSIFTAGIVNSTDDDAFALGGVPAWAGFVSVDDVDDKSDLVVTSGAKITREPTDIPGVGRYAIASDPDSVPIVLFQSAPGSSVPEIDPGTFGLVGWRELQTTDAAAAFLFYGKLFGWQQVEEHDMGPLGTYHIFGIDGVPLGGIFSKPPGTKSAWLYYFIVEAASTAVNLVESSGGTVIIPPHQVPGGGWIARFADPQGAEFAVMASNL